MGFGTYLLLCCGGMSVVGALFFYFSPQAIARRRLRRADSTTIIDAPNGANVAIAGEIRGPDEPLRAPLTGRPCAFWRIEAYGVRDTDLDAEEIHLASHASTTELQIKDGSGVAVVHTDARAQLLGGELVLEAYASTEDVPAAARRALWPTAPPKASALTIAERIVTSRARVRALGTVRWERAQTATTPYRAPSRTLLIRGTAREPLVIECLTATA